MEGCGDVVEGRNGSEMDILTMDSDTRIHNTIYNKRWIQCGYIELNIKDMMR